VDPPASEVNVAPAERKRLAQPHAAEHERCEHRSPGNVPVIGSGLTVQLPHAVVEPFEFFIGKYDPEVYRELLAQRPKHWWQRKPSGMTAVG
jgi:hypothetical protein